MTISNDTNTQVQTYLQIQDGSVEHSELLPPIEAWGYCEKSLYKDKDFNEDAYNIKQLDNQSLYISMCDGVSAGLLSRLTSRIAADTMAEHQIMDVKELMAHADEMKQHYSDMIHEIPSIKSRVESETNGYTQSRIDNEFGATTFNACHIRPSEDKQHYIADVTVIGNGAFFVIDKDGKLKHEILHSRECLAEPYYSGIALGAKHFDIRSSEGLDDYWEVKKSLTLDTGDIAFFTTDGFAEALIEIIEHSDKYGAKNLNELYQGLKNLSEDTLNNLRHHFVKEHLISDDDVTLIKLTVPDHNQPQSEQGVSA